MTPLSKAVKDYLELRHALGFKLWHETWWLPDFARYLEEHGTDVITADHAFRWARQPSDADASWWGRRLGAVRQFARHHRAVDPRTEVPSRDLIPYRTPRRRPYLYSADEVAILIRDARRLSFPLRAASYATIIGLLAVTGMRVGEALGLDEQDVDCRRALLTVRGAKFNKTRQIPVHPTTLAALDAYARRRDRLRPNRQSPSFFLSSTGDRIAYQRFSIVFRRLLVRAAIGSDGRKPRIHDLRHTFAVRTLCGWYQSGADVDARMPWLSAYLGHRSPETTYWYFTATPELITLAAGRLEKAWAEVGS